MAKRQTKKTKKVKVMKPNQKSAADFLTLAAQMGGAVKIQDGFIHVSLSEEQFKKGFDLPFPKRMSEVSVEIQNKVKAKIEARKLAEEA